MGSVNSTPPKERKNGENKRNNFNNNNEQNKSSTSFIINNNNQTRLHETSSSSSSSRALNKSSSSLTLGKSTTTTSNNNNNNNNNSYFSIDSSINNNNYYKNGAQPKLVISSPMSVEQSVHVEFDSTINAFRGVPSNWQGSFLLRLPQPSSPSNYPPSIAPSLCETLRPSSSTQQQLTRINSKNNNNNNNNNNTTSSSSTTTENNSVGVVVGSTKPNLIITSSNNNSLLNTTSLNILNTQEKIIQTQIKESSYPSLPLRSPKIPMNPQLPIFNNHNSFLNSKKNNNNKSEINQTLSSSLSFNKSSIIDSIEIVKLRPFLEKSDPLVSYDNLKLYATGNSGDVYSAQDRLVGSRVAIKKVSKDNKEKILLLVFELRIIRLLQQSDQVISFVGAYISRDTIWIVWEMMESGSLADMLSELEEQQSKIGKIPEEIVIAHVLLQCLNALKFLHSNRIVHRDIRSDNLLLSVQGRRGLIKLSHFGRAAIVPLKNEKKNNIKFLKENIILKLQSNVKSKEQQEEEEEEEELEDLLIPDFADGIASLIEPVGTAFWMAPEVAKGQPYACASDIWSFGALLYEMVNLVPPKIELGEELAAESTAKEGAAPLLTSSLSLKRIYSKVTKQLQEHRITARELLKDEYFLEAERDNKEIGSKKLGELINLINNKRD